MSNIQKTDRIAIKNYKQLQISIGVLKNKNRNINKRDPIVCNTKNINDYSHLISTKACAIPMISWIGNLRLETPSEKSKKKLKSAYKLFSFYEKDMEKWNSKQSGNTNRSTRPFKILDVDIEDNSGTVKFIVNLL